MLGIATSDVSSVLTIPSTSTSTSGGGAPSSVITVTDGEVTLTTGGGIDLVTPINMITNPGTSAVYRWLADEHTSISPQIGDTEFFSTLPGSQGVLIK
jgi:hypothetical protein